MRLMMIVMIVFMTVSGAIAPMALAQVVEKEQEAAARYAPMAPFEKFAGKTMRGTWTGDDGAQVVDINKGKMILNGRAFQGTHKIEGSTYGGRTIIFYDEAAKEYIYHYFTTGGFHTTGVITLTQTGFSATEKVNGHPSILAVRSTMRVEGDQQIIDVDYQNKDETWSSAPRRVYEPYAGPGPSWDDAE